MAGKKSRLRDRGGPSGGRLQTHVAPREDWNSERPIFSLHHMPGQTKYCLDSCAATEKQAFADAIWKRSRLTWAELGQSGRHQLGYEKIEQRAISRSLPSVVTPDVTLIAFRFSGKAPMVGFRERNVFHVLWLDRDYTLYDHG